MRYVSSIPLVLLILTLAAGTARSDEGSPGGDGVVELPARKELDVSECAPLRVSPPDEALRAVRFRLAGRRGWIVRMPAPRKPAERTPGERLATVPAPAVWQGRVYAGVGFDGWALHGFDAISGKHHSTTDFRDNGPTSPTITPRKLLCNTESCTTYAITPRSGQVAWEHRVGPSVMGAPASDGRVVYTAHRTQDGDYRLTAMRIEDGTELWDRALTHDIYGKPILANGCIYVGCRDGVVACFERGGRPMWFARVDAGCAPWVTKEGVYVAESDPYRKGAPAVRRLDVGTGRTVWRTDVGIRRNGRRLEVERYRRVTNVVRLMSQYGSDGPRPVVLRSLCLLGGGPDLLALDAATGGVRWIRQLPAGRRFHAPPAVIGERLVFATLEGLLVEVDARSGAVTHGVDLQGLVSSQPVFAQGRVHVTSGELLYGLPWGNVGDPAWPQWGGASAPSHSNRPVTR